MFFLVENKNCLRNSTVLVTISENHATNKNVNDILSHKVHIFGENNKSNL